MKSNKYFQVSTTQLFLMSILISILVTALLVINTSIKEYLQLPIVTMATDGKCAAVSNFKNGEAFTCNDVGTILRNYRVKTSQ